MKELLYLYYMNAFYCYRGVAMSFCRKAEQSAMVLQWVLNLITRPIITMTPRRWVLFNSLLKSDIVVDGSKKFAKYMSISVEIPQFWIDKIDIFNAGKYSKLRYIVYISRSFSIMPSFAPGETAHMGLVYGQYDEMKYKKSRYNFLFGPSISRMV